MTSRRDLGRKKRLLSFRADLDEDVECAVGARDGRVEGPDLAGVVHEDADAARGAVETRPEAPQLVRADALVRQQDVGNARGDHRLELRHRLRADAARDVAQDLQLLQGEVAALVRLGVGPTLLLSPAGTPWQARRQARRRA